MFKVKFGSIISEHFKIVTGLRQGYALSPALFNIRLEWVIRETLITVIGVKIGVEEQLVVVGYVDDIVIMEEDEVNLKAIIRNSLENGKKIRLKWTGIRQNTWS